MPYEELEELPESIRGSLPKHAQEIYLAAFNNAFRQYRDPDKRRGQADLEETAHRVAWAAVKEQYRKDRETGKWKKK